MVELGDRVKDTITGFSGIATGRAVYFNGCVRFVISSEKLSAGEVKEIWIDEPQLKIIKKKARTPQGEVKPKVKPLGGPRGYKVERQRI